MLCDATAFIVDLPDYCYDDSSFSTVMPAFVAVIRVFLSMRAIKTGMTGTSPGMTR
jgi:hypothetical protein